MIRADINCGMLLGAACLLTSPPGVLYADMPCQSVGEPAKPNFDFTADLSRWGSAQGNESITGEKLKVKSITINKLPIFDESDPRENNLLYRWANKVHIETRDKVVREQLLFAEGDEVDARLLAESERLTRDNKYASDARIRILEQCENNDVKLEVVTREVWTLTPEVSLKSAGGDTSFKIGMRDSNFLGTGHQIATTFKDDAERQMYTLQYRDQNYLGKRLVLDANISDNSDGFGYRFELALPFYSLESRQAWSLKLLQAEQTLSQYDNAKKVSEVSEARQFVDVSWGYSKGLNANYVNRWLFGIRHDARDYSPGADLPLPHRPTQDRNLTYPYMEFERIEDDYVTGYNISQIYRTEDLHVGKHFRFSIGSNANQTVIDGSYSTTLLFLPKTLLQLAATIEGTREANNRTWRDVQSEIKLDYHRGQTETRSLYIGLTSIFSRNQTNGRQGSLGGNNGLRGFGSHFLTGEKSVLLTLEQRQFTSLHLFNLVRVGYAAFIDVGKVFDQYGLNGEGSRVSSGVHSNIGVGLRLAPSKSEKGQVIHIDLAYPLTGNFDLPGLGRSIQFVAELKKSF